MLKNWVFDLEAIRVKGLPRRLNKKSFIALKELLIGLRQAGKLIDSFKPDLVIGTGGFVSGPVLFRAAIKGYKTMIHEQNSLPGLTNRILSRFVNTVAVTYESSKTYFKHPDRVRVTGNPIRAALDRITKSEASYNKYSLNSDKPVVFSFGGSNGSEELNDAIAQMIIEKSGNLNFQLLHATGENHYKSFCEKINVADMDGIRIEPYIHDISKAYDISDLTIASSGAITLAEISLLGLPSILIPKAYTTENHQEYNARLYVEIGASEMILEDDLNSEVLYNKIEDILKDENTLAIMGENARKLGNPDATSDIADLAFSLIK
ncbi:UDP-N-acetylglucosamine--N-acetylmuramyl-(pentapeptide) pyrophosphoryl-undecaprenol N-acetylglucosamine transferase [Microaceticoccus formicicus]|uniref:UDP-N-acetylglucosamine--N-acetylmuramyl- (pentapeptide) pyrophosphoryl-undecaprenol N-acetylglucosamine transferase n=1 Tax=Microaceticoccus formicicus TaxID=3118105 RepID=UPI003CD0346A|nr:UDP-N-acetylglucosamine--N-acetylmuramyl-(pentapeptide) pyrophosphoryl-undecaprenol N-acetylglucosamine transferase [Peptoniphilaceae bacterium AMB_02]